MVKEKKSKADKAGNAIKQKPVAICCRMPDKATIWNRATYKVKAKTSCIIFEEYRNKMIPNGIKNGKAQQKRKTLKSWVNR